MFKIYQEVGEEDTKDSAMDYAEAILADMSIGEEIIVREFGRDNLKRDFVLSNKRIEHKTDWYI